MMFCSTIIPTIARPSLDRAVSSVIQQELEGPCFEVIVVNDSGQPLAPASWQRSQHVTTISTSSRDKSVARNTGAAIARGDYLHFLDDDDWLLPDALQGFWAATQRDDAALVYGHTQLFDRGGRPLIELRHELPRNCFVQVMAGEWIPTGAYLVKASAFFGVGGYDPTMPAGEDIDLCRRIALRGSFAGFPQIVLCATMGQRGSSTDYTQLPVHSRRAREAILNESGILARLLTSASDGFWRGRIVRTFATSAVWNARRGRVFTASSRMTFGLIGLVLAAKHLLSPRFWRALMRPYESFTFVRGFQSAGSPQ